MKKIIKKVFYVSVCFFLAFLIWTVLVKIVDVQNIGPHDTAVGFATLNKCMHDFTGTHIILYNITDWLSIVPILFVAGFAFLGLAQWIRRKNLLRVDHSILILGAFFIALAITYIFFEIVVVNYRPILIEEALEASYPSSTTILVLCIMPASIMQLNARIKNKAVRICSMILLSLFSAFMLIGRLLSGVHWITDIFGGILFSVGFTTMYYAICGSYLKDISKE